MVHHQDSFSVCVSKNAKKQEFVEFNDELQVELGEEVNEIKKFYFRDGKKFVDKKTLDEIIGNKIKKQEK